VVIRFSREPHERRHQRGADIGRQEAQAGIGSPAHAAVEGPGGAINGKREGINVGIGRETPALLLHPVCNIGHAEQEKEVPQDDQEQQPG